MEIELRHPSKVDEFSTAFGYRGHNFDLFLTWLEYGNSFESRLSSLNRIVQQRLVRIGDELSQLRHFHTHLEWADFVDPHCKSHSRRVYRSVTNFICKKNKLQFYSDQKNEKFFEVAKKIWNNPRLKKRDSLPMEDRKRIKLQSKYAKPEIVDYLGGKISIFTLIKIRAEMKKKRSPMLKGTEVSQPLKCSSEPSIPSKKNIEKKGKSKKKNCSKKKSFEDK